MEIVKSLKIKTSAVDGYSLEIPIGVDATNVVLNNKKDLETSIPFFYIDEGDTVEIISNWLANSNNQKISPKVLFKDIYCDNESQSFKQKYLDDLNGIEEQIKKLEAADETINNRIDNIIAIEEEQINPYDLEILDVRIPAYGPSYNCAGASVRGQIKKLKNNYMKISKTQPVEAENMIWVSQDTNSVEIPDMEEFNALKARVAALEEKVTALIETINNINNNNNNHLF